jgi:hypothetical protein
MNQTEAPNTKLPAPTREQLAMAYRHMANPGWPPTLEAALQVHHYSICIHGLARRLGRATWTPMARPLAHVPSQPVPPTPTAPRAVPRNRAGGGGNSIGLWLRPNPPQWIDGKRLAANDRDDD